MIELTKEQEQFAHDVTKALIDRGKLIEAGWEIFRIHVIPKDAPQVQVDEMQLAFMAGADHVYSSIMNMLDPGSEPTDADLKRMDQIDSEIMSWREKLKLRVYPSKGKA